MPEESTIPIPETAAEVLSLYKPGRDVLGLHRPEQSAIDFVAALASADRHPDALRFWAHALPKRAAVWWACLGVERFAPPASPPEEVALKASRDWVSAPEDDDLRRACFPAAEDSGYDNSASLVAVAAYFSGGSIAPPDVPDVDPPPHITGDSVGDALTLAAVSGDPERAPEIFAELLKMGREVAEGNPPWPDPPPPRPEAGDGEEDGDQTAT